MRFLRLFLSFLLVFAFTASRAQILKQLGRELLEKTVETVTDTDSTKSNIAINEKGEAKESVKNALNQQSRFAINEKGEAKDNSKSRIAINEKGEAKGSLLAPGQVVSDTVKTAPEQPVKESQVPDKGIPDKEPESHGKAAEKPE